MQLPSHTLDQRLEAMPTGQDHVTVWHLCQEELHRSCANIGNLAIVMLDVPEIPDNRPLGMFLMRLHPQANQLREDGEEIKIWLPAATSFRHSTVWHEPKPKVKIW